MDLERRLVSQAGASGGPRSSCFIAAALALQPPAMALAAGQSSLVRRRRSAAGP
jgi:hypothetical protein